MALRRAAARAADTTDALINFFEPDRSLLFVGCVGLSVIGIAHWATVTRPRRNEFWKRQQEEITADASGRWNDVVRMRRRGCDVSTLPGLAGVDWATLTSPWSP